MKLFDTYLTNQIILQNYKFFNLSLKMKYDYHNYNYKQ